MHFDAIICSTNEPFPTELRTALQSRGHSTIVASAPKDLSDLALRKKSPLLILFYGAQSEAGERLVEWLIEQSSLMEYPLLLIGTGAPAYERMLTDLFPISVALDIPCRKRDLFGALHFVARESGSHETAKKETEIIEVEERIAESIRLTDEVLRNMAALSLHTRTVGGDVLASLKARDEIDSSAHLPGHKEARALVQQLVQEISPDCSRRLNRVGFMASRVADAVAVSEELSDPTKAAAFLSRLRFPRQSSEQWNGNYLSNTDLRQRIAQLFAESASTIVSEHSLCAASDIVGEMSRILGDGAKSTESDLALAASAIIAADMVDRVCRSNGAWNPRGVYTLLNLIKGGRAPALHPHVLSGTVKMLVEAVSSKTVAVLVPKNARNDPSLREAAAELKRSPVADNESKLRLAQLTPGMRLARPIVAYDGRVLVSSDPILDADLIWRIWQLAAIRPINQPLFIAQ